MSATTSVPTGLNAWVAALRPRQWAKNIVCFAGLIFSGQLFEPEAIGRAGLATAAFCLLSSAVYLFNDLMDRERDRLNPRTASRPIAAGTIAPLSAAFVAAILLAVGFTLAFALDWRCLLTLTTYAGVSSAYSLRLKRVAIADVMCIALGFVLRVMHGAFAVDAQPTAWTVVCMFFLALFLGFAKRRGELGALGDSSGSFRPALRAYSLPLLDMLLGMSATMTIVCYGLFTVQRNPTLVITIVPVAYCVMRYMSHVLIHEKGESPESVLFGDRVLWLAAGIWALACVAILYGGLKLFVESDDWRGPPR